MESIRHNEVLVEAETADLRSSEFLSSQVGEKEQGSQDESLAAAVLLWHQRQLVCRVTISALVLSTLLAFLIPKRYASTTMLMPPDSQAGPALMAAAATKGLSPTVAGYAGELLGVKNSSALWTDLLRSRTIQDRLVDRFHLQDVYWERYRQDARKDLDKRTDISEERKSGTISISVTDRDPQRAALIAQGYTEELNWLLAQDSTSAARQERVFIEQRLEAVRSDLDRAQRQFSEFASKNTALDIKEQTRAMVESAAQLQGQLIAAESELQGLETTYTSDNVRVRSLRAEIHELKSQLTKLGGSSSEISSSQASDIYPAIRQLPLLGVQWADLYREVKVQEAAYELLTQQYELARIEEAKEIPVVHVVDPANVPEKKSFPPRLLLIAVATLLAFVAVSAWVLAKARWHAMDSQDPRKVFLSEIIGTWHLQLRP